MSSTSLAHPGHTVPEETRERVLRGLALYRERSGGIEPLGHGVYAVPSCTIDEVYTVHLDVFGEGESCSCRDFRRHKATCKHVAAAAIFRAKARMKMLREAEAKRKRRRDERLGVRLDLLVEKLGA